VVGKALGPTEGGAWCATPEGGLVPRKLAATSAAEALKNERSRSRRRACQG
jgi:hypothetical protein